MTNFKRTTKCYFFVLNNMFQLKFLIFIFLTRLNFFKSDENCEKQKKTMTDFKKATKCHFLS